MNHDTTTTQQLSDACSTICTAISQGDIEQLQSVLPLADKLLNNINNISDDRALCVSSLQLFPTRTTAAAATTNNYNNHNAAGSLTDPNVRKQVHEARSLLETFRCEAARIWNALNSNSNSNDKTLGDGINIVINQARCLAVDLVCASLPKPCPLWRDAAILSASAVVEASWMMLRAAQAIVIVGENGSHNNNSVMLLSKAEIYLTRAWELATSHTPTFLSVRSCMSPVAIERLFSVACDAACVMVDKLLLRDGNDDDESEQQPQFQRCAQHMTSTCDVLARQCSSLVPTFLERAAASVIQSTTTATTSIINGSKNNNNSHQQQQQNRISLTLTMSKQLQHLAAAQSTFALINIKLLLQTGEMYLLGANGTTTTTRMLDEALAFATAAEVQCRQCAVLPCPSNNVNAVAEIRFAIERLSAQVFHLRGRVYMASLEQQPQNQQKQKNATTTSTAADDAVNAMTSLFDVANHLLSSNSNGNSGTNQHQQQKPAQQQQHGQRHTFAIECLTQLVHGVNRVCTLADAAIFRGLSLLLRVAELPTTVAMPQQLMNRIDYLLVFWLSRIVQQQQQSTANNTKQQQRQLIIAVLSKLSHDIKRQQEHTTTTTITVEQDRAAKCSVEPSTEFLERETKRLDDLACKFSLLWTASQRALDFVTSPPTNKHSKNSNNHDQDENNSGGAAASTQATTQDGEEELIIDAAEAKATILPAIDPEVVLRLLDLCCHYAAGCGVEQRCVALRTLARAQLLLAGNIEAASISLTKAQQIVAKSPHTALLWFQLHLMTAMQQPQQQQQQHQAKLLTTDLENMAAGERLSDVTEALSIASQMAREAKLPNICAVALRKMIELGAADNNGGKNATRLLSLLQAWVECETQEDAGGDVDNDGCWLWCAESARNFIGQLSHISIDDAAWWATTIVRRQQEHHQQQHSNSEAAAKMCCCAVAICRHAIAVNPQISKSSINNHQRSDEATLDVSQNDDAANTTTATAEIENKQTTVNDLHRILRWAAMEHLAIQSKCEQLQPEEHQQQHHHQFNVDDTLQTIHTVKQSILASNESDAADLFDTAQCWQQLIAAEFVCVVTKFRQSVSNSTTATIRGETADILQSLLLEMHQQQHQQQKIQQFLLDTALTTAGLARLSASAQFYSVSLAAITDFVFPAVEEMLRVSKNNNNNIELLLQGILLFAGCMHNALDTSCATRTEQLGFAHSATERLAGLCNEVFEDMMMSTMQVDTKQKTQQQQQTAPNSQDAAVKGNNNKNDDDPEGDDDDDEIDGTSSSKNNMNTMNSNRAAELKNLLDTIVIALRSVVCHLWNSTVFEINLVQSSGGAAATTSSAADFIAVIRSVGEILKKLHRSSKALNMSNNNNSNAASLHVGFVEVLLAQFEAAMSVSRNVEA